MGNGNRLVDGNGTDSDSLDGHDRLPVAVERFVADEHGDVRSHGVSHHVGDLQGAPVGVFDAQHVSVVVDARVDRSAVAVREGDNLLLDAVLRNGLQLDRLCPPRASSCSPSDSFLPIF